MEDKRYNDPIAMNMDFASLYPSSMKMYFSKKDLEIAKRKDKLQKIIDRMNGQQRTI